MTPKPQANTLDEILNNTIVGEQSKYIDFTEAKQQIQALITEARIDEWKPFLKAEVSHGGSPAPFNPEGLPIKTSKTEELTELLRGHAKDRLTRLKENK